MEVIFRSPRWVQAAQPHESFAWRLTASSNHGNLPLMLRDLEELVLRVQEDTAREHIREAVRCYHAGAYRAAVVMAFAAGMHDLRRRVDELCASGAGELAKLKQDVDKLASNESPWEQTLINGCRRDDVISIAEEQKLLLLLKNRHMCAHPSGHVGSPEEARGALSAIIDLILAKPLQAGGKRVMAIIRDQISGTGFLGTSPQAVVEIEISRLQPRVLPLLGIELCKVISSQSSPTNATKNAIVFIAEMTRLRSGPSEEARNAAWHGLGWLLTQRQNTQVIDILRVSPECLAQAEPAARGRLIALLLDGVEGNLELIAELVKRGLLREEEEGKLLACAQQTVDFTIQTAPRIASIPWPALQGAFAKWMIDQLDAYEFSTANKATMCFRSLLPLLESWTPENKARAVHAVLSSARRNANKSVDLCESGLPGSFMTSFIISALEGQVEVQFLSHQFLIKLLQKSFPPAELQNQIFPMIFASPAEGDDQVEFRRQLIQRAVGIMPDVLKGALQTVGSQPAWLAPDDRLAKSLDALMGSDSNDD